MIGHDVFPPRLRTQLEAADFGGWTKSVWQFVVLELDGSRAEGRVTCFGPRSIFLRPRSARKKDRNALA